MAVAMITIPDGGTQEAINVNRAIFLATAIITVFLAMIASYVIVRYVIVKPLKHLRDVSDEISRGNIEAAGRNPHRRRVRGAGHGVQPHVAAPGHARRTS